MKSLQVVTPHMKCIYNCPFCIAKTHDHDNNFTNNYTNNYDYWKNNLIKVIKDNNDLKYVVITGTNEPMQSKECVKDIISIVRNTNKDIQIEIQTRYYEENYLYKALDVVAYSVPFYDLIKTIKPCGKINRYVILLTNSFDNYSLNDILNVIPSSVKQITFKVLHDSNGKNIDIDSIIDNYKMSRINMEKLKNEVNNYKGDISIRFDENCMDSTDRYKVFREDGNLYNDWN